MLLKNIKNIKKKKKYIKKNHKNLILSENFEN